MVVSFSLRMGVLCLPSSEQQRRCSLLRSAALLRTSMRTRYQTQLRYPVYLRSTRNSMLTAYAQPARMYLVGETKMRDSRKHYTQMTTTEVEALRNAVRAHKSYKVKPHAAERMASKNVDAIAIAQAIAFGSVVEAHKNVASQLRVLLRKQLGSRCCCVVVSVTTRELVTAYWNDGNDNHATLDASVYTWKANMVEVIH